MYRVFLVGLGNVGMGYDLLSSKEKGILTHASAFSSHKKFKIVGAYDIKPQKNLLFEKKYGIKTGKRLIQEIIKTSPKVIVVSTPTKTHYKILSEIIAKSKTKIILCEKPFTDCPKKAAEILQKAKKSKIRIFINYQRRVQPDILDIKKKLLCQMIKGPLKGCAWYGKGLQNNGSHFLNLFDFWFGKVKDFKILKKPLKHSDKSYDPDILLKYKNAEIFFLATPFKKPYLNDVVMQAKNGILRYEHKDLKFEWHPELKSNINFPPLKLKGKKKHTYQVPDIGQLNVANEIFKILSGKNTNLCSGKKGLETLKLINKVWKKAQ